jgi:hypothetical protein
MCIIDISMVVPLISMLDVEEGMEAVIVMDIMSIPSDEDMVVKVEFLFDAKAGVCFVDSPGLGCQNEKGNQASRYRNGPEAKLEW